MSKRLGTSYTTSLDDLRCDANIYIVALKDDVLQELLPLIVKGREHALFVHTAGSIPLQIWEGIANRYGVLYPMQTFSKQRKVDWNEVSVFVEALQEQDLEMLKELANNLTPKVYEATSEQRKSLHIAAVFACNFSNHMYTLCDLLLSRQGLPFEVMLPLIDETTRKIHQLRPKDAQTGPAIRYDVNVMNKHLEMLETDKSIQEIYRIISKSIHEL